MTAETALAATALIACLAHLQHAFESLYALASGRMRLLFVAAEAEFAPRRSPFLKRRSAIAATLTLRACAAGAVLFVITATNDIPWLPLFALCLTSLHYAWFRLIGGDGAEQMALMTICAVALTTGPLRTSYGPSMVLFFIGAQSLLAYWSSGFAKLFSETWRSGRAVAGVVATEAHGSSAFHAVLRRHAWLGVALSRATITLELTLPIAALLSSKGAIIFMAVGATFHLGCAFAMGLNGFPLAFFATYPGVYFLSRHWMSVLP